ncbi:Acetyltransferase (GNAT) family protein [Brevibacterium sandarakinum]|uniref:Acetyltransferase (GNAT) family protein n=1 Tax=Brevibacterium sandarakinum TaxID=629680 RepID=A0A1H1XDT1_BRESA|nr:GNAT family N-acetyltransferase [Brevibacterium sandarakinum]SDT07281.1 Acetyltransferase (GNAT) family protein [Brevibacterium sandarakinum]
MELRRYDEADRESVAVLDVETPVTSFADVELHAGSFSWQETALADPIVKRHDLAHYLTEGPAGWDHALVAIRNDRICAFSACEFSAWNRRLTILHMYVSRPARGQGIGRALLDAMLSVSSPDDAQHVWLETQVNNVPAIRAYEQMGFRIVGLDQTLYADHPDADTALYMSRRVAD